MGTKIRFSTLNQIKVILCSECMKFFPGCPDFTFLFIQFSSVSFVFLMSQKNIFDAACVTCAGCDLWTLLSYFIQLFSYESRSWDDSARSALGLLNFIWACSKLSNSVNRKMQSGTSCICVCTMFLYIPVCLF